MNDETVASLVCVFTEIGEDIPCWRGGENHVQHIMATGSFVKRDFPRRRCGEYHAQYCMATGPFVKRGFPQRRCGEYHAKYCMATGPFVKRIFSSEARRRGLIPEQPVDRKLHLVCCVERWRAEVRARALVLEFIKGVCSEYSLEHTNRRSQKETNKENIVSLKQSESVLVDQIEQETPEGSSCQSLEPSILVVLDDVLGLNDLTSDHECGEKPCIDLDLKIVTQCASSTQVINVNEPNDYVDDGEEEEEEEEENDDDDDDELKDPIYAPNIDDDLYSDSLPSSQDGTPVKRRKTSTVSSKSFYKLQNIPLLDLMPVSTNTELKPTNKTSVPIEESFETNEIVFDTDDIVSRRERRGFCISNLTLSQAYHEPLKIKKEKLSDLLELFSSGAIREQYHHFYGLLQGTEEIDVSSDED
uniref:Uncharacterized protein n=1 Tax=Timema douglasi TaxID=61478 RepID=A0A7R8VIT8_TIMDO|nr:unnamed protein product [Timema douglasi]